VAVESKLPQVNSTISQTPPVIGKNDICIVIPYYNHGNYLSLMIEKLALFGLPLLIVDDGSTAADAAQAHALRDRYDNLELLTHDCNTGKGSAVITGIIRASERNFQYVLQIDADNQHNTSDVPKFVELSQRNPDHLILGKPVFGPDAPLERRYCRQLCNIMVWLQTASYAAQDGMFGFRIYPIRPVLTLHRERAFSKRMGFDTEVIIRLMQSGTPALSIPTTVTYRQNGVSHFRYFRDNIALVRLHVELIIRRLGYLLTSRTLSLFSTKAKVTSSDGGQLQQAWHTKSERGSIWGLQLLLYLGNIAGQKPLLLLLRPVVYYFILTDPTSRQASQDYLKRITKLNPILSTITPYQHLLYYAESLVRSVFTWDALAKNTAILKPPTGSLKQLSVRLRSGRGGVILGAHFGQLETMRARYAHVVDINITPLMYLKNSHRYRTFLKSICPQAAENVIHIEEITPATIIELQARIKKGDYIAIHADRLAVSHTPGSKNLEASNRATVEVEFLGEKIMLPAGPFLLAYLLESDILSIFNYYNSNGEEIFQFKDLPSRGSLKRQAYIQLTAQEYATELTKACLAAPLHWFNFYDYFGSNDLK
jgi:predicted LPLAT superfamily acyltransferase